MATSISFFLHTYTKVWTLLSCSAPSFPLTMCLSFSLTLSLSLFSLIVPSIEGAVFGIYGGAAVLCHWGLLIGVPSMHPFVCCVCITGRASWWLLSRLNRLLASNWWLSLVLSIWMSHDVSLIPMPSLHICTFLSRDSPRERNVRPQRFPSVLDASVSAYICWVSSAFESLENLSYTFMSLVKATMVRLRWCCLFKTASLPTLLLRSFIRSGDKGVVARLLREMPRNDWKAQHMLCAVVGGGDVMVIVIACVIVYFFAGLPGGFM